MKDRGMRIAALILVLLSAVPAVQAAPPVSTLTVLVSDAAGAVEGALVSVTDSTGESRLLVTDSTGTAVFDFRVSPRGSETVVVQAWVFGVGPTSPQEETLMSREDGFVNLVLPRLGAPEESMRGGGGIALPDISF